MFFGSFDAFFELLTLAAVQGALLTPKSGVASTVNVWDSGTRLSAAGTKRPLAGSKLPSGGGHMKKGIVLISAAILMVPTAAFVQGTVRGAEEGATVGDSAAGPVAAVVMVE